MSDVTTPETIVDTVEADAVDNVPNTATVPSFRLKEEADKRRAVEEENKTLREQAANKEAELVFAEAKWKFGADAMTNEKVIALREEHPTLSREQAISFAGLGKSKPNDVQQGSTFVGRPSGETAKTDMTLEEKKIALSQAWKDWAIKF